MQLYGSYTSPYVRHCRIVLAQSQLEWHFIETDLSKIAEISPTKKIPFLTDKDVSLSDSTTICRHIRQRCNTPFLADLNDHDLYCQVSTLMDSAINLFYLEKDGIAADSSAYLQRQKLRVDEGLIVLNNQVSQLSHAVDAYNDAHLRLGCFLSWGLFRQRFSLDGLSHLQAIVAHFEADAIFVATRPPA